VRAAAADVDRVHACERVTGQQHHGQIRRRPRRREHRRAAGADDDQPAEDQQLQRRAEQPVQYHGRLEHPVTAGGGEQRVGEHGQRQEHREDPQRFCHAGWEPARGDAEHGRGDDARHGDRRQSTVEAAEQFLPGAQRAQPGRPVHQRRLGAQLRDAGGQREPRHRGQERADPARIAQPARDQPRGPEAGGAGHGRTDQVQHTAARRRAQQCRTIVSPPWWR
jgi:hypothetical protein